MISLSSGWPQLSILAVVATCKVLFGQAFHAESYFDVEFIKRGPACANRHETLVIKLPASEDRISEHFPNS